MQSVRSARRFVSSCCSNVLVSPSQPFKPESSSPFHSATSRLFWTWLRNNNNNHNNQSPSPPTPPADPHHTAPHLDRVTSTTQVTLNTPKLTYLNIRVRGEITRLLMAETATRYVDERVTRQELQATRATLPFRVLPVWTEITRDSQLRVLGQSGAINRLLAKRFNMMGDNEWETALIDSITEEVGDVIDSYVPIVIAGTETMNTQQLKANLQKLNTAIDNAATAFAHYLATNPTQSGYIVGNKISLADLAVYFIVTELTHLNKTVLKDQLQLRPLQYESLKTHVKFIGLREQIAQYVATRPQTVI